MRGLRPTPRGWAVMLILAAALGFATADFHWDGQGWTTSYEEAP